VTGVVHAQLEAAGEIPLGLLELGVRDELVAEPRQLDEDGLDGSRQAVRVDARRDLEGAGVGVVDDPRRDVSRTDRNRRLLMPSPRTALRTASVQLSGWSRCRAGTPRQTCAWLVARLPVLMRGPAGRTGAGA
jgi:hypothetical protein